MKTGCSTGDRPGMPGLWLVQQVANSGYISLNLGFQFIQAGKFTLISYPGNEFQAKFRTIYLGVEIKQVGFNRNTVSIHGGPHTDIGGGLIALTTHGSVGSINTIGREEKLFPDFQVGGVESNHPSPLVSLHHPAGDPERAPQALVYFLDSATSQGLANSAAAHPLAIHHEQVVQFMNLETHFLAHAAQEISITLALITQAEIAAPEPAEIKVIQQALDKSGGPHISCFLSKGIDDHQVDALCGKQAHTFFQGGKVHPAGSTPDDRDWMREKSQYRRPGAICLGRGDHSLQQLLVTTVHTIKYPDRQVGGQSLFNGGQVFYMLKGPTHGANCIKR